MESDSGGDNTGVASDPSFPRPLQPAEAAALRDLIERAEVPQMDVLLAQVDVAQAVGGCECPCPTISLTVDAERAVPVSYTATPIATAQYDDGGVMVWVEDGWLSHFELYWYIAEVPPSTFPPPEAMFDHRVMTAASAASATQPLPQGG